LVTFSFHIYIKHVVSAHHNIPQAATVEKHKVLLTAVCFIRQISTIIVSIADPVAVNAATCVVALELEFSAVYRQSYSDGCTHTYLCKNKIHVQTNTESVQCLPIKYRPIIINFV